MRSTIDRAGRVVIPKPIRDSLGLGPETPVTIIEHDGQVIIEAVVPELRLVRRGKGLVAVPDAAVAPLSADQVREALEHSRSRH